MKKTIYGKRASAGEQGETLVAFDDKDHFDFICKNCVVGLRIEKIDNDEAEAEDADTILYFFLKCPECKKISQRKLRINDKSIRRELGMHTIKDDDVINVGLA